MTALAALTERMLRTTLRDDIPFAIVAPAVIFSIFYFALRNVIDTGEMSGGMSYAQYLLPIIIVQVSFLGALTAIDRAVSDQQSEFGVRLRTLPISALTPLAARAGYCMFRGVVALLASIAVGYAFGFRFTGGWLHTTLFVVLVLAFTLALSLGADALGTRLVGTEIGRDGTSSQLLLIPQMLLFMVSTGLAPVDAFPNWLQSFVRYQPVSQVTDALRGCAGGNLAAANLVTTLAWCLGLLAVFGGVAAWMQRRRA